MPIYFQRIKELKKFIQRLFGKLNYPYFFWNSEVILAILYLEIRGAGNILGKEQSGNINQVGLNLYCQMLSEAIEKIKRGAT